MSWLVGENAQTQEEADAHLAAQQAELSAKQQQRIAEGTLTQEQADANNATALSQTTSSEALGAALGAAEGSVELVTNPTQWAADTRTGAVMAGDAAASAVTFSTDIFGTIVGKFLKSIPWWVWLAAAAALFVWMGGLTLLKGRLAKA
jgi:hypothetical protein